MNEWDVYASRIDAKGGDMRTAALRRETHMIGSKIRNNLSYQTVSIDGISQSVAIINTDTLNEKFIFSLPGEDIRHGGLVEWMGNHWLITERDANTTINTRAKMIQCNYLLKWVSDDKTFCEQWCVVEDGTKYLIGEYEDRNFVVTRGDSRIAITIARNDRTVLFNRKSRFLVDEPESRVKLAYLLTKPLKIGSTFNEEGVYDGVYKFVLQEVVSTDNDHHGLGIADYYKHFPRKAASEGGNDVLDDQSGKKVWL